MSRPAPEDVRGAWDRLAAFWDEEVEAGRTWQRRLIAPAVEALLDLSPGERVLELGAGNGTFARRMAELGADVVATDFSEPMLERARSHGGKIEYRLVDATDAAALRAIGEPGGFDAAVANMAVMDMAEIDPMVREVRRLIREGGRFVLSLLHPAFNSGDVTLITEITDDERGVRRTHAVKIARYTDERPMQGVGVEDQPVVHWYFHRTLTTLLGAFFGGGWILDGIDEPVDTEGDGMFAEVPGVLVLRFRPA
ncbi:MAG TPA: class I SAM-dependent methyltransferase [Actinomycetota bacterium]|nr:class I SAM-dependent methyltransferase [Actinomycetota bacterium]